MHTVFPRRTLFRFRGFNGHHVRAAAKWESLLKFVVLAKHARVPLLKEDETDLLDMAVCAQKVPDRGGSDFCGLSLWITESAGRNGWKCDGSYAVLAREE